MNRLLLVVLVLVGACLPAPIPGAVDAHCKAPELACAPARGYCAGSVLMNCLASGKDALVEVDCAAAPGGPLACAEDGCDQAAFARLPGACCRPAPPDGGIDGP